uniref:Coiled-coil domain-containing protein 181 n=1 Tax=Macrostomum lignano TaxID=282301 RepID=A0A1I8IAI9_9PLAT
MTEQDEPQHDEYGLRDDQLAAMGELDRLQTISADDWTEEADDEFLKALQEPGPDYEDTLARLNQLNAELEREPSPEESAARPSRVRFSAELVQVAPSPSPPTQLPAEDEADSDDSPPQTPPEQRPETDSDDAEKSTPDRQQPVETDGGGDQPGSGKVLLVSDGGQYKYVDRREVEADQIDSDSDEDLELSGRDSESNGEPSGGGGGPRGRPGSAPRQQRRDSNGRSSVNGNGRPGSARSNGCQDERERDNELAFQAWLRAKRQQQRRERRERERREEAEALSSRKTRRSAKRRSGGSGSRKSRSSKSASGMASRASKNWLQSKRKQQKKEKKYQEMEREEMIEHSETRTSRQCRRAFKLWLRRKEEQKLYEEMCERQRARVTQLAMRRSRKSQALANALLVASSYKYMDYYGYR